MKALTERLIEFISASPSPYHAAENVSDILKKNGFEEIALSACAERLPEKFFLTRGSALVAVKLPLDKKGNALSPVGMRICAAHTDNPGFRLKPNAVMKGEHYCRLNVERYGGGIWSTWLDRPLGIAGRVIMDCDGKEKCKNVVIPMNTVIPNVSIHFNRQLNDGYVYNAATDLIPLLGDGASGDAFTKKLCMAAGCAEEQMIDYDLCVYNPASGIIWGGDGEYFSAPRIDDLQCVFTSLCGFLQAGVSEKHASVLALFDCEEVGSVGVSGASSDLLTTVSDIISEKCGIRKEALISESFMLSADNAHGVHPNHPEMSDPTNRPVLGGGVVLKYNSSKRYITDGKSGAFVRKLCKKNGIPMQTFANRSDIVGGSTLGCIAVEKLSVAGADIGLAQLAMHSSYETAACADNDAMVALTSAFFSE